MLHVCLTLRTVQTFVKQAQELTYSSKDLQVHKPGSVATSLLNSSLCVSTHSQL